MPKSDFVSAAATPIRGRFNQWTLGIADGLADGLSFDPMRLGSQLYPTVKPGQVGSLLQKSLELARRGLAHATADERAGLTGFVTTLNAHRPIGFDAFRDAEGDGPSLNDKLGLSLFGGGNVIDAAITQPTDEDLYDPFFTFLIANRLQAHFTVEREPARPPRAVMDDVSVTSRPAPAFQTDETVERDKPMLLLGTPAQRLMLWDVLMGPKASFGKRRQPQLPVLYLPRKPHPVNVVKSVARLVLGGMAG